MTSLSPQQFPETLYHGTIHPLEGDTLVPGKKFGATNLGVDPHKHHGQSRHDWVSATDSEDKAWTFATGASGLSTDAVKPRTRVHVLEPHPDTKIGVEHIDHPVLQKAFAENAWKKPDISGEHVAPSFRVRETLDTRPGWQGTFPQLNWNQFAAKGLRGYHDMNHPSDHRDDWEGFRQRQLGKELAGEKNAAISEGQGRLF